MKPNHIALAVLAASAVAAPLPTAAQQAARSGYIIQLADAPAAAYEGGVSGLQATRPAPGQRIDISATAVQNYLQYLDRKVSTVAASVPSASIYQRFGLVFNGFAAKLTAAELQKLQADPAVKAITADEPMKLDTSHTTSSFLGLGAPGGAWSRSDANGRALKGEGVIIGVIDSGVWPENPSVSDRVDASGKPVPSTSPGTVVFDPLPAGRYRGNCQAGEAFTAALCNNKLVGAQFFDAGFRASGSTLWPSEYRSPRDEDGHGSHTLTTAGGNASADVDVVGSRFTITGMAPRARVAAYKVCWSFANASNARQNTCFISDSVAAINKAVADGVDVINFSIGGSQTSFLDAVSVAFFNATAAGVFVATSAGNDGPANTVAKVAPWNTTVGNSTHDRYTEATVNLGNGATARGASFQTTGLPSKPIVLAINAGVTPFASLTSDADRLALARCYNADDRAANGATAAAALDPAKVAGRILVCYRGGNVLFNKADAARIATAAGMIIQNISSGFFASANSTLVQAYALPTVHLNNSYDATVIDYAATGVGTGSFGAGTQVAGVVAPVMNSSSSRGPNQADLHVLKPDLTGPGTDIIAGYVPPDMSFAERDGIVAGTVQPRPGATLLSGTSMASPHVAGAAALLKQQNPAWSPAAIQSALLTSAAQTVRLANGSADLNRWAYGAGHLAPNAALDTSVVHDINTAQFAAFGNRVLPGFALNLASITRNEVIGSAATTRTLTNRGSSTVTLNAAATLPGFAATVTPANLTLAPGASASYSVRTTRTNATLGAWSFGEVVWTGSGQRLRSPLSVRATALVASSLIEDTRTAGARVITVGTGYDGTLQTQATGLVAATRNSTRVARGTQVCSSVTVPDGALQLRAQLFNSDTEGGSASDLDLFVYDGAGSVVGISGGPTSDELVSLNAPAAGAYRVCVDGYAPVNGNAGFTLSSWVLGPATATQNLRAAGPSVAYLGGTATVAASWNVPAGNRHLGLIQYRNGAGTPVLGTTTVWVDTTGAGAAAPLLRSKPAL